MNKLKLYQILTYAGAIPFIYCALLTFMDYSSDRFIYDYKNLAATYGLVIISFMAGIYWGAYFQNEKYISVLYLIISNMIVLVAWFAFLIGNYYIIFAVQFILFLYILWLDYRLCNIRVVTNRYFLTRLKVSMIVLTSILIIMIKI